MSIFKLSPAQRAELNTKSDWRGALEVSKDWGLVMLAFTLSLLWPHPLIFGLSLLLLAAAQAGFAILQHEASHRSLFASSKLNDRVGEYLCALPILQSMPGYRAYHMTHHRLAGTREDPDLVMTEPYPVSPASLRRKLLRDASGLTGIKSVIGLMGMAAGYWKYELTGRVERVIPAPKGIRGYVRRFIRNNGHIALLWQAGIATALIWLGNGWLYLLWAAAFLFILPICMRIRQIADHAVVADAFDTNPLRHARTTQARWYEKLLLAPHYEHYHLEHHFMPTAPCWQLPRLHAILKKEGLIPPENQADSLFSVLKRVTTTTQPA
ncbi:MAG: fatty acid desaturase [Pseudomonadota bacterium]